MRYNNYDHDWDTIDQIAESYQHQPKIKSTKLKQLAKEYLNFNTKRRLSKYELRQLLAKTEKLKVHNKKDSRKQTHQLEKQIIYVFNIHK